VFCSFSFRRFTADNEFVDISGNLLVELLRYTYYKIPLGVLQPEAKYY